MGSSWASGRGREEPDATKSLLGRDFVRADDGV
jgi:hypothetical protein